MTERGATHVKGHAVISRQESLSARMAFLAVETSSRARAARRRWPSPSDSAASSSSITSCSARTSKRAAMAARWFSTKSATSRTSRGEPWRDS